MENDVEKKKLFHVFSIIAKKIDKFLARLT